MAWNNSNGDTATFSGTAGTVTLEPGISAGEIDFSATGYTIAAGTDGSLAVTGSGTIDVASGISGTISAPLVGSNGLTLPGSGTLLLDAANSFTGATVIDAGTLELGNSLALGSSTRVSSLAAGTLDLDGQTIGSGVPLNDFAGTITNSDTGVAASFGATINATTQDSFAVAGSGDITLGGTVYGSSAVTLTKSGGNTLTISDASAFDGLSLVIDDGNIVQGGSATYTTLDIGAGSTMTIAPSGPGITLNILDWDPGQTGPTAGVASGGSGTWDTTSADWYNPYSHEDQAWNNAGADSAVFAGGDGTVTVDSGISADEVLFQTDGYILDGGTLAASGGGFSVAAGINATVNSTLDGSAGLSKIGAGNLIVGGSNSYTGQTWILSGTLTLANSAALGDSGYLTAKASGTLDLNGQTIDDNVPLQLFAGTITNSSDTAASFAGLVNYDPYGIAPNFTVSGGGEIILSGAVDEYGWGTLTKTGTNTLILSGSNDNIGLSLLVEDGTVDLDKSSSSSIHAVEDALTINGGTVQLTGTGGDQIGNSAPVTIDSGTLDLNGESETIANLSGSGGTVTNTLASSTSTLTIGADGTSTIFGGTIQDGGGAVALTKTGTGTLILDGENTYSGGTTIDAGTFQLGDGFSSNGSVAGNITDDGSLVFAEIYAQTYAGVISGTGTVAQDGYNALTLTGGSTYTGATSVDAGILILGAGGSLANTAISVADGAQFDPQPSSGTVSAGGTGSGSGGATLTLASGSTFDMTDGSVGTFDLQQQTSFSDTALSIDAATLNFDLSSSGADLLAATGAASVSGINTINITGLSAGMSLEQTFTLISAASGLSGTFEFANGTTTESLSVDDQAYTLQLGNSGTAEILTVAALPNYAVFINGTFVDGSTTVDLGTAYANEPAITTVMIENVGTRTLTLADPITLPTGFTLAADYETLVLAAGQSTTFALRLDSPVEESFSGTLAISSDDPVQPTFDVTISGQVVARVAGVADENFAADGDGWTTVSNSAAVGGQELTAPAGTGENTASWVFNDLDPTLEYQVYATWTAASGHATNATYTILDGSNIEGPADAGDGDTPTAPYVVGTLATVSVDQTSAPSDETVGGIAWSSLGSFTATSGVMEIDFSDNANGTVVADGVRIVAVHVKEPPVLTPITDQSTTAGDTLDIQLLATDPDVSSGLTYSLLNTTPPGMSINASTGLIAWDTTNVFAGTYTIMAQVSDGGTPALTDTEMFSVAVSNSSTPSGSGEDVVSVYSTADANEGGSAGDIRLVRTGDLTGSLTVLYQIDESEDTAAQHGSTLEYVGPDVGSPVDGILYGQATFAAGAATADITIDASADTDNADNPTVNFELLPYDYTIPGDAGSDLTITGGGYTAGSSAVAAPAIRDALEVANGSATVGLEELVADHHVLAQIANKKAPAGATVAYTIVGGNGEGVFTLTSDGRLLLAKDAASALSPSYSLEIKAIGTFADGTQTNVSDATEDITMRPTIGVYGSTMAVRGTADTIDLTFVRFAKNVRASLAVNFTIDWTPDTPDVAWATAGDLTHDESFYDQLEAVDDTHGQVVIEAGDSTATMVLYAEPLVDGEGRVGVRTFVISLDQSTNANAIYDPTVVNTHLPDANADTVLGYEQLYILDGVTAFAQFNKVDDLQDPIFTPNPGINANDVSQGGLGDCYFLAAEAELAKSDWQAIQNLITQNSDGTFAVNIYNWQTGTTSIPHGWITYTFTVGQVLSNGWSMAQLSGDYNPITSAVEIWPQLLEAAWAKLNGGTYQGIVNGETSYAMIALTGLNFDALSLTGMTNQAIGQSIQKAIEFGPVALGTLSNPTGTLPPLSLGPRNGSVHLDHAYVVVSVDTDDGGNVTGVKLLNPWGYKSKDDYEIDVPSADFSAVFQDLYFEKPYYWR